MLNGAMWSSMSIRRVLPAAAIIVMAALLAGCPASMTQPERPGSDRQANQAEKLSRDGDYRGAAQAYEALAAQSSADVRDRYLLRAAREYLRAGQTEPATALLKQVSQTLPSADYPL